MLSSAPPTSDSSWEAVFAYVMKMCILALKLGVITYLSVKAFTLRQKKYKTVDLVQILLITNIIILYAVVIVDMTKQYILLFFALIYLASYVNFLGYNVLIRNIDVEDGEQLKKSTNVFFITMNIIYAVNALCAINAWYGPWCNQGNIYPPCMATANCLVWANFGYHLYLHHNNYFLKWKRQPELTTQSTSQESLIVEEVEAEAKTEMSVEDRRKDLF